MNTQEIGMVTELLPAEFAALCKAKMPNGYREHIPVGRKIRVHYFVEVIGEIERHQDTYPPKPADMVDLVDLIYYVCDGKPSKSKIKAILKKARNKSREILGEENELKRDAVKEIILAAAHEQFGTINTPVAGKIMGNVVFRPV